MNNYVLVNSPEEILKIFNRSQDKVVTNGLPYYLFKNDNQDIITNVPASVYKKDLKLYNIPAITNKTEDFINILKQNIDYFQNHPETENFQLNSCYNNSEIIFEFLSQLNNNKEYNIFSSIKLVYGYFSRKLPFESCIDNYIIGCDNILLHDWHVWNYINNFLIDVSLFSKGTFIGINDEITDWGIADDHVFFNTPVGIDYFGIEHENKNSFVEDFRKTFNV